MLIKLPEPKGKLGTVTVNGPEGAPDWDAIDWRLPEGNVRRLRRGLLKATRGPDWATGRALQKMKRGAWSHTPGSARPGPPRNAPGRPAWLGGAADPRVAD